MSDDLATKRAELNALKSEELAASLGPTVSQLKAQLDVAKAELSAARNAKKSAPDNGAVVDALKVAQIKYDELNKTLALAKAANQGTAAKDDDFATSQAKVDAALADPKRLSYLLGGMVGVLRSNLRTDDILMGDVVLNPSLAVTIMLENMGKVFGFKNQNGDIIIPAYGRETFQHGLELVASRSTFDPVAQYLEGLPPWDGVDRIGQVLERLDVEDPQPIYATMVRKMMISAVRRVRQPGCKVDTMLVLQAREGGEGKSSFYTALFGREFFSDSAIAIGNKDAYLPVRRFWAIEWSEMAVLHRAESRQAVKSFISSSEDTFRASYARTDATHKRRSIFVGSTNTREILEDDGGNRRFWIIPDVGRSDLAWVAACRDQLWAQAKVLEAAAEPHWFDFGSDEYRWLESENEHNMFADDVEDEAMRWIAAFSDFCTGKPVLGELDTVVTGFPRREAWLTTAEVIKGIHLDPKTASPRQKSSVARAFEKLKWRRTKIHGFRAWRAGGAL